MMNLRNLWMGLATIAFAAVAFAAPPYPTFTQSTDSQSTVLVLNDLYSAMTTGTGSIVGGNVASGATDSGNPVKVGGKYNLTPITLTDGQRGDLQVGIRGALHTEIWGTDTNGPISSPTGTTDGVTNAATNLQVRPFNYSFNGTTWDRSFTCALSAQVTVTAGSTTQIVALSGSTVIRVCSYQVGIATTGTYSFVYGTGSNCATGTTVITPPTSLTAGNVVTLSGANTSVIRALAANALCLSAVTGNVQAYVTYAQY